MPAKPTPKDKQRAHELALEKLVSRDRRFFVVIGLIERSIVPGAWIGGAVVLYFCLKVVAGVFTSAVLQTWLDSKLSCTLAGVAVLLSLGGARLRKRAIVKRVSAEHQHTVALEKLVSEKRESSDMPYTGDTKPGD